MSLQIRIDGHLPDDASNGVIFEQVVRLVRALREHGAVDLQITGFVGSAGAITNETGIDPPEPEPDLIHDSEGNLLEGAAEPVDATIEAPVAEASTAGPED